MESSNSASRAVLIEGARGGVALGACVIVLAVLGLTPSLSWLPELPLVTVALVLPVVAFVVFGKSALNVAAGILLGVVGGVLVGTAGALLGRRAARV